MKRKQELVRKGMAAMSISQRVMSEEEKRKSLVAGIREAIASEGPVVKKKKKKPIQE